MKLVNIAALRAAAPDRACGFESRTPHHLVFNQEKAVHQPSLISVGDEIVMLERTLWWENNATGVISSPHRSGATLWYATFPDGKTWCVDIDDFIITRRVREPVQLSLFEE